MRIFLRKWCTRKDSNLHAFRGTTTSRLRVYQFHHECTRGADNVKKWPVFYKRFFLFVCDRCFAVAWPGGLALNRVR